MITIPEELDDTLPPHDPQAEWFALACCVEDPSLLPQLREDLFHLHTAKIVLSAIQGLQRAGHTINEHAVFNAVDRGAGVPLLLAMNDLPSVHGFPYWLDVCTDLWREREELRLSAQIAGASREQDRDAVSRLTRELSALQQTGGTAPGVSAGEAVPLLVDRLEAIYSGDVPGIATGLPRLDAAIHKLQAGGLYVCGARPSIGKTSLLLNIASHAAKAGVRTMLFSLEMGAIELVGRMAATESGVPLQRFYDQTASQRDLERFTSATVAIKRMPLRFVDDRSALGDIVRVAAAAVREHSAGLILVDYVQRITLPGHRGNRTEQVTEISGALKDLARTASVPVLVAAQLSRLSAREDRSPVLSDLRDSGAIEQDADCCWLLHRKTTQQIELILAKNRSGPCGKIDLDFDGPTFRFTEASPVSHEDLQPRQSRNTVPMPYPD